MAAIATAIGDAGAGPSAGTDSSWSELGSVLGEAYDSASGEETPGGEAGFPESLPEETTFETPAGDAPVAPQTAPQPAKQQPQQQATPPQQPQQQPQEQSPWPLSADGKSYQLPTAELPRVQSAMQFREAVGQIFPTPQEAQMAAGQASELRMMTNDWLYGSDDAIQGILSHFSGANNTDPTTRAQAQRSFERMVSMAPSVLQRMNPQAYQGFLQSQAKAIGESLYAKAAQTGDPQDFMAAQSFEWGLTGQYKTELPKQDPQQQMRSQFEQREQAFNQRQEAALRRDVTNFSGSALEGAKFNQLGAKIDQILAPVKNRYSETAYEDMKAGIQRDVMNQLMKSDWFTEHKQHYDQLVSDFRTTWNQGVPGKGLQPRVQAYVADFLKQASRGLQSIAAKRVNATTQAHTPNGRQGTRQSSGAGRPSAQVQTPADQNKRLSPDEWDSALAAALKV